MNIFASSDAEENTSGPLTRGVVADLPLLRTLFAIFQGKIMWCGKPKLLRRKTKNLFNTN